MGRERKSERQYESIEYRFLPEELLALGQQLARANNEVYTLRSERKAAMASLDASIKAAEKMAADLTMKIERKSEMRDIEVAFVMDRPRPGLKTIIEAASGTEIRIAVMSLEEQQATLDFGEGTDESGRVDRT